MDNPLLVQFGVATLLVIACVGIHGVGLFSLSSLLCTEAAIERINRITPLSPRGSAFTLMIVLAIILLHGVEIWLFTLVYLKTGAIGAMEDALYFSTISYSTVGYNDTHIDPDWRLLGAFESILGMILLGWSTAFFFRMLGRIDTH